MLEKASNVITEGALVLDILGVVGYGSGAGVYENGAMRCTGGMREIGGGICGEFFLDAG